MIVFGLLLGAADRWGKRTRELNDLTYPHGLALRLRAGARPHPRRLALGRDDTLGLALGYKRPAAARVRVPARGPGRLRQRLLRARQELRRAGRSYGPLETAVATVVAFVVGLGVIAFLMQYLEARSFLPFVIYRLAVGVLLIVLLSHGRAAAVLIPRRLTRSR